MAITVKHTKVSTIPDGDDSSLIRPSDWNADHTLVGLGTMAEQNANNVTITGGAISGVTIPASNVTGTLQVNQGGTGATTLTGYVKGTGTTAMTASATIPNTDITGLGTASTRDAGVANGVATLDAGGKVPTSQIPLQGDLNYQGTWNATTNTPTLTSSVGTKGYYYVVDVTGSTNLNGITSWNIGDWAIFNGSIWEKVDNTDAVTSVNGQIGTVVLTTTNIAEGTNQYFTQARARQSLSAGTGISYDNTTGVITNSSPSLGGDVVGPASATDNAIARFDTTTGKLIQNSVVTVSDTGVVSGVIQENFTPVTAPTYAEGRVFYDTDAKTLCYYNDNSQMTVNIGQESIVRVRNQTGATIPNGTVVYVNGATGNTPTIQLAIATSFATSDIIGVTTTDIPNNGHGYVTTEGLVNGLDTSAFNEGDAVFLSATTAGTYTATEPTRPNYSIQVGVILRANPSVGTLLVSVQIVSTETTHLIGTVAVNQGGTGQTSYTNGQLLIGNTTGNTLTKSTLTAGTGIGITNGAGSITIANTAPDQTVSITGAGTTTVTGTYPNFTVTSNDQYVGTVTSVSGTGSVNGITLSGTVTSSGNLTLGGTLGNIANNQLTNSSITINGSAIALGGSTSVGTVTSVSALTLGTSGTDLSSTVANGTTTPVITLNVPTASATNRGALSAADWTTFNNKANAFTYTTNYIPYGQGTTTPNQNANFTFDGTTQSAPIQRASNGIVTNNKTIGTSFTIPSTDNAMSAGPVTLSAGVTVTVSSGSRWVVL